MTSNYCVKRLSSLVDFVNLQSKFFDIIRLTLIIAHATDMHITFTFSTTKSYVKQTIHGLCVWEQEDTKISN